MKNVASCTHNTHHTMASTRCGHCRCCMYLILIQLLLIALSYAILIIIIYEFICQWIWLGDERERAGERTATDTMACVYLSRSYFGWTLISFGFRISKAATDQKLSFSLKSFNILKSYAAIEDEAKAQLYIYLYWSLVRWKWFKCFNFTWNRVINILVETNRKLNIFNQNHKLPFSLFGKWRIWKHALCGMLCYYILRLFSLALCKSTTFD